MATTVNEIREWLEQGNDGENTHMIVVVDTFDYVDYPVYIQARNSSDARNQANSNNDSSSMTRVMEVYNYSLPIEEQLAEFRARNY